jgi:hypothetical protein
MIHKFNTYHSVNENLTQARSIIRRKFSMDLEDIKNLESEEYSERYNKSARPIFRKKRTILNLIQDLEKKIHNRELTKATMIPEPNNYLKSVLGGEASGERISVRDLIRRYVIKNTRIDRKLRFMKIYSLIKNELNNRNKLGYIGHFTKLLIVEHDKAQIDVDVSDFTYVIRRLDNQAIDTLRNLDDGGKLAKVQDFNTISDLMISLRYSEEYQAFKTRFISELPSAQRNMIWKDNCLTITTDQIDFMKTALDMARHRRFDVFLSKVSRIENAQDMYYEMKVIMRKFSWSLGFFTRLAESTEDVTVLLTEDNKLLVEVSSSAAINVIASMTNWCIKQASYFNDYTANSNKQYIVYDFNLSDDDSDSIIGITATTEDGQRGKAGLIRHMHNKYDSSKIDSEYVLERLDYILMPYSKTGYVPNHYVDLHKMYGTKKPTFFGNVKNRIRRFFEPVPAD